MKTIAIFLSFTVLASFLVKNADAVACTSLDPDVPDGCTNCADEANAENDDCTTTTTTTTTVATTTESDVVTLRPNRKTVRVTNLTYTNLRRLRVNRNTGNTARTNGRNVARNGNRNVNRRARGVRVYRG